MCNTDIDIELEIDKEKEIEDKFDRFDKGFEENEKNFYHCHFFVLTDGVL